MKPRYDLIPADAERAVALALTAGAEKHGDWGWETKKSMAYYSAARRHTTEWLLGNYEDPETCLHPLAHAAADILIALSIELRKEPRK